MQKRAVPDKAVVKLVLMITLALALPLLLSYVFFTAEVYPCSYSDVDSSVFAGYGHHSLTDVLSNGFSWTADGVPHQYVLYRGDGPYLVSACAWTIGLYVPIFLGLFLLGLVIFKIFSTRWGHAWTTRSTIGQSCQKSNK